jgi:hypothetical protein
MNEGDAMTNERISQLERSVKRWRLVSLVLAFLLICAVGIGCILASVPPTQEHSDFWLWLPWIRARHQEEMARREAEAVRQQMEAKQREKQAALAGEGVDEKQP